jgi:C4-dicarboxylate-specific signal transduction histidine kinase
VLISLIKNVTEAMENNNATARILTLRLIADQMENYIIEVEDTGEGGE